MLLNYLIALAIRFEISLPGNETTNIPIKASVKKRLFPKASRLLWQTKPLSIFSEGEIIIYWQPECEGNLNSSS